MPFEKGISGNFEGRPKGSKNKINNELREKIGELLNMQFDKIKEDFIGLEPKERIRFYTDLLQYGLPKLQAVQLETEFEKLSDEQLDELYERIMHPHKTNNNYE